MAAVLPPNVGRYRLGERLGSGGMGVVVRAHDPQLNRDVALKLVKLERAGWADPAEAQTRLLREGQAMARLAHPNVCPIYDVGRSDDGLYIAMELIDGCTLRQWLERENPSWREILAVALQAGNGLDAAHREGLVHRDFKPDNVMIGKDGRVRVLDFGLARAYAEPSVSEDATAASPIDGPFSLLDTRLTRAGAVVGTPRYMAPEQHEGREVDARTDQYAFCVAFHEALFGVDLFPARGLAELAVRKRKGPVEIEVPRGPVPPRLDRILRRGMSPNPDDRHPSMAILLAQLRHDPRRAWRRFAAVASLGVVGIVGVAVAQQPEPLQPCAVALENLQAATQASAELRDALRVDDGPAWNRVESELAAFGERWLAQHEAVCPAGAEEPLPGREHELDCMLEQVRDLDTLRRVVLEAEPTDASRVADAIAALEPPQACAGAPPRAFAEDEAPVRELLREARIHDQLRHGERARALADEAVVLTQAPGLHGLHAEALLRRGYAERTVGALADAERDLGAAYFEGLRGGDEDTAAAAAVALVFHFADAANTTESDTWARHARSLIERGAGTAFARVNYHNAIGRLALERGNADAAIDAYATALALMGRGDVSDAERGTLLLNLGMARGKRGDLAAAVRDLESALAFNRDRYGEVHAGNITALLNLGTAHDELGDDEAARDAYERALAIAEQVESPPPGTLATLLTSLAQIREELGDGTQTLQLLARARATVETAFGPDHPRMAAILVAEGTALRKRERFEEARRVLTQALEIRRAEYGDSDERVAIVLANLANVEGAAGRAEHGVPLAEEALRILELRLGPDHPKVATARGILDELRSAIPTSGELKTGARSRDRAPRR